MSSPFSLHLVSDVHPTMHQPPDVHPTLHHPLDVHPTLQLRPRKGTLRALPSIDAIKRRRLEQEELDSERERPWQRGWWARRLGKRQVGSPDARRSGRKSSELSLERCYSRSRSPGVCERIVRRGTRLLPQVSWNYHMCMLDPTLSSSWTRPRQPSTVIKGRRVSMLESHATPCGDGWEGMH